MSASGELAALAVSDVQVALTATATPTAFCSSNDGNRAAELNPAPASVPGSVVMAATAISYGNAPEGVTSTSLTSSVDLVRSGRSRLCERELTQPINATAFTSAIVALPTAEQWVGTPVVAEAWPFSMRTANGVVPMSTDGCTAVNFRRNARELFVDYGSSGRGPGGHGGGTAPYQATPQQATPQQATPRSESA